MKPTFPTVALRLPRVSTVSAFEYAFGRAAHVATSHFRDRQESQQPSERRGAFAQLSVEPAHVGREIPCETFERTHPLSRSQVPAAHHHENISNEGSVPLYRQASEKVQVSEFL